jgi:hypothetical protein
MGLREYAASESNRNCEMAFIEYSDCQRTRQYEVLL